MGTKTGKYYFTQARLLRGLLIGCLAIVLPHCGKRQNKKLALSHYKMSILELGGLGSPLIARRKALCSINKALEQSVQPHYLAHKATLLFLLGDRAQSKACFKHALALESNPSVRAEITNNYACLLASGTSDTRAVDTSAVARQSKRALRLFAQLVRSKHYLTPEVALVNMAKIYADHGKYGRAKKKLMRAVALAPDYTAAHRYLQQVCQKLDQQVVVARGG